MAKQSILLLTLLASVALSSPLRFFQRSNPESAGAFQITDFYDGGNGPHSSGSNVRFGVADTNPSAPISYVQCSLSTGYVPVTTMTGYMPCNDTSVAFVVQTGLRGYILTVVHGYNDTADPTIRYTDSATKFLGDDIATFEDPLAPTGDYQYLNHTADFDMPYFRDITTAT